MLIVRGLIVLLSGLAFVFLPGAVIASMTRRDMRYETGSLLWGMGLFIITLFPALFVTSLLRMIIFGQHEASPSEQYGFALLGAILVALFVQWGTYLMLRFRNLPVERLLDTGMMIGFGIGILTNVFQGFGLVGAGYRLIFGDVADPAMAAIAEQPWAALIASMVALNVYRIALVGVSAALGALVGRSLRDTRWRWLWLAILLSSLASWSYTATGLALGADSLAGSVVVIIAQGALAAVALWWLRRELPRQQAGNNPGSAPHPATAN